VLGGIFFILTMGAVVDGDAHPSLPPKEYEIVPYKDKAPGFHNHHGVLDVWAHHNISGYVRRGANSTTLRLSVPHHEGTFPVLNQWLKEKFGRGDLRGFDWTKVSPRDVVELSERQFDAAEVPHDVRLEYYREFTKYIYGAE
jgi:hypothetical protein